MAVSLAFGWFTLLPEEFAQLGQHAAAGILFVENIKLFWEVGYFDTAAATKPLLHLWSLSIEEQLYLAVPAGMLVASRFKVAPTLSRCWFPWVCVSGWPGKMPAPPSTFRSTGSGRFCLAPCWPAWSGDPGSHRHIAWHTHFLRSAPSFCWLACSASRPSIRGHSPCSRSPAPSYSYSRARSVAEQDTVPLLVCVGLISYPLYLWYWPILSFAQIIAPQDSGGFVRAVLIATSVILAWTTYAVIERPVRFGKGKTQRRLMLSTIGTSVLVAVLGMAVFLSAGLPNRSAIAAVARFNDSLAWQYAANQTCLDKFDYPGRKGVWWFCAANGSAPTVLLLGNSYANHLYPGLVGNDRFRGQKFTSIGSCDPASEIDWGYEENDISPLRRRGRAARGAVSQRFHHKTDIVEVRHPEYILPRL